MVLLSASFNQLVNLLVSIAMVPLLLRYLTIEDFVVWTIFITFGAITLQFESAIQQLFVRELARAQMHDRRQFSVALHRTQRAYRTFSFAVLTVVAGLGFAYINHIAGPKLHTDVNLEWVIFIVAYSVNYYFGSNSAILLSSPGIGTFYNTNSISRLLNLATTYIFLKMGLAVLGLALSFAISVLIGCLFLLHAARAAVGAWQCEESIDGSELQATPERSPGAVLRHTTYVLASFLIYKGCFLAAAGILPTAQMGGYALSLQACTIISSLAIVPVQIWLRKLVKAVATGSSRDVRKELAATLGASSTLFLAAAGCLFLFGATLLSWIGSRVALPGSFELLLVCIAFFVELLILVLVSYLLTARNFTFVEPYLGTSILGILWTLVSIGLGHSSLSILLSVPLILQSCVCLPLIARIVSKEIGVAIVEEISKMRGLRGHPPRSGS